MRTGYVQGHFRESKLRFSFSASFSWWSVDLGAVANLAQITLWNRTDCCADRLSNFYLFVSATDMTGRSYSDLLNDSTVWRQHTPGQAPAQLTIPATVNGRYVRVQLAGSNYLSLAEVQVWGQPLTNLAQNKAATQSSTAYDGAPTRAVDGNTNGNWSGASVTHTDYQSNAWWQVDLGAVANLTQITLWNRTDCCAERLSNFYLFVSTTDMAGRSYSDLLNDSSVWRQHTPGQAPAQLTIPAAVNGRYVRVQLAGGNYLSLAEVQVWGRVQ